MVVGRLRLGWRLGDGQKSQGADKKANSLHQEKSRKIKQESPAVKQQSKG
jgi:hypothetical protein